MQKSKQREPRNIKDLAARNYFRHEEAFTDLFNGVCQDEAIIKAEELKSLDITEIVKKREA